MAKPTMGMGELPDDGNITDVVAKPQTEASGADIEMLQSQLASAKADLGTDSEDNYTENEDGSVDVDMDSLSTERNSEAFDENLADGIIDSSELDQLGRDYSDLVDQDVKAREKRDAQYADGIKRTGMGGEAPGGADFDGASRAVHPMLTKACVDFASRAVKELFPSTGPCKTQIIGEQTEEKLDRAERKKKYMNWQATSQIEENRSELEKLLSQVPLGGAQYKRWWYDSELKRNRTEAVFIDDVFTPYGHSDFYTAPRVTHRQRILRMEYERRIRTGLYLDLGLVEDTFLSGGDESKSQQATDKVQGDDPDAMHYNEDGLRMIYQIEVQLELESDPKLKKGKVAPYILHIDSSSKRVLGLYRNWKETDDRLRKKHWMSEWPFIPWRGGPAVGLSHIIGSMSGAATGALRAIIDAAQIQNFPGGLKLSGGKTSGQSIQVNATELASIDAPAGMTDPDIRKLVMAFPFSGPSAVLFQTLEWLTQQAEGVVATASEKIADGGANMPMGTALALIEHGSANFSAIHSRLHAAMKHDLEIQHRLNGEYMDDEETIEDLGDLVAYRADFEGPMDIIPVSDPNIFSEAQRYAQLQAVMQLKSDPTFAPFFKPDQLLARALKLMQVPDVDGITNLPKDAKKLNPLEENHAAASADDARPLKVYNDQDDLAHLKMHIHFAVSPMMGANPLMASGVMPKLLQHCKEHLLAFYKKHTEAAVNAMRTVAKMQNLKIEEGDIQLQGAAFADQEMATLLGPMVMPGLQQMQKIVQQIGEASAPKPDPAVVLVEATKKEIKTMQLQADSVEKQKDRDQQTMAANIAAQAEQIQVKSQEALAQLTTHVEMVMSQQKQGADQLRAEFDAASAAQLMVLQQVLTAALQPTVEATEPDMEGKGGSPGSSPPALALQLLQPLLPKVETNLDTSLNGMADPALMDAVTTLATQMQGLQSLLAQERQTNQVALSQLAQGIQSVASKQTDPNDYEAEIYTGPDGVKRARRVPKGQIRQGLPAPQQQPQQQPQQPPQDPQGPLSQLQGPPQ